MADLQGAFKHLNATIEREILALNHPGLTIGITDRQRLLFVGNYGLANRAGQQPVTSETLFQIGSISKAFTSIALLQLQEQGLLSIEQPVTQYLPWFEIKSDYEPITLRHLMSHTAGIIMGADATQSAFTETWNLRFTQATAPPGERFHYSNSGYKVLGLVLQKILNESMAEILTRQILSPLGMEATEPVITNASRARLAVGYEAFYDDRPLPSGGQLAPATWFESDTADGSISANAADMCCFLRALLNQCEGLLTSESFGLLTQALIPTGDDLHGDQYGLGLCIQQIDGHRVISHSGGMVGYTADLLADMDAGLGVVVLCNGPGEPELISRYVLKLLRAAINGGDLPAFPSVDPDHVINQDGYAGDYTNGVKTFTIHSEKGQLILEFEGSAVLLEPRPPHGFLVPHPEFEMFLLRFGREANPGDGDKAPIIEAFYGPDWYPRSEYQGEASAEVPAEWQAYSGHYRSHNPWLTNFRVISRRGGLFLVYPAGEEETLHPIEKDVFRVGDDPFSPEFIHFGLPINGKTQQANLSGGDYCRSFTP